MLLTCHLYLIGRILFWLHSLFLQFYRTVLCLSCITVYICWCLLALFILCVLVNITSVQSYPTAIICVSSMHFDILLPGIYVNSCYMARHLVFSGVRLIVTIMWAQLSHITDC